MFREACQALAEQIIQWRRDFHKHPELSFQEKRTREVIASFLRDCGLEVREQRAGYGVIGELRGAKPGPTIAFRADMDALPIQEETGLSFSSQVPGVMHACGHDAHMAVLMGAVRILSGMRDKMKGNVRFIFQPAEELSPGGAQGMIKEGALDGVAAIFGIHIWSEFPVGTFHTVSGPIMAAADEFKIVINGKGGHGALPHQTIDSILVASHLMMAAQHIVSRQLNPLESGVISFGFIHAGEAYNVIAHKATLGGTIRSFTEETRNLLTERLRHTATSIAQLYGADIHLEVERGYPPVVNHEQETLLALDIAKQVFGEEKINIMQPMMAAEDFSYYLEQVPGAFCFVGAGEIDKPKYPHHHPRFTIDERALPLATEWFCRMAKAYLF